MVSGTARASAGCPACPACAASVARAAASSSSRGYDVVQESALFEKHGMGLITHEIVGKHREDVAGE